MTVPPIPEGHRAVTPYLIVDDAREEIEFLKAAFAAQEHEVTSLPDGAVMHAELRIGDSIVMLGQSRGEWKARPCAIYLYVPDIDATHAKALAAGGSSVMEPADQFYGDRSSGVKDSQGNLWFIATHIEDVSPEEIQRRIEAMSEKELRDRADSVARKAEED